jgi:hypothetical protein
MFFNLKSEKRKVRYSVQILEGNMNGQAVKKKPIVMFIAVVKSRSRHITSRTRVRTLSRTRSRFRLDSELVF